MALRIAAGIAFVLAGALEVMFLALSIVGTLMGGAMSIFALSGEMRGEEMLVGPALLVFYGLWLLCTLVAGPLHLVAGVRMLMGYQDPRLAWVAVIGSLLPLCTVYCGPTSLLAGLLGLVAIIVPLAQARGPRPDQERSASASPA